MSRQVWLAGDSALPAVLVLFAGLIAYLEYVNGARGPMVMFGVDDANYAAADAWLQVPAHMALAAVLAIPRTRFGAAITAPAAAVLVVLALWASLMVVGVLGSLGKHTDLADLAACIALFAAYGSALYLVVREQELSAGAA
jgi:hypothetical protein